MPIDGKDCRPLIRAIISHDFFIFPFVLYCNKIMSKIQFFVNSEYFIEIASG